MNIFEVLNANYEVFHSRMLAWLLDPSGSHGAGPRYLTPFLRKLNFPATTVRVDTEVQVSVPNAQRWRLADIVIRTEQHFILIENKVDPFYQDVQQVVDEITGGIALAESEGKQFRFVFVAPGPLSSDIQAAIGTQGTFVPWQSLIEDFSGVDANELDTTCAAVIDQYLEFCRGRFARTASPKLGKVAGDDVVLTQSAEALRAEVGALAGGTLVTAVDLWTQFCEQYPDHVSRLESRWAESSHYSAKSWLAARLKQWATKRDLIEDTGDWKAVDRHWGFPEVRVYRRLSSH